MNLPEAINTAARHINRASERLGAEHEDQALDIMLELRNFLNEPMVLPLNAPEEEEPNTDELEG